MLKCLAYRCYIETNGMGGVFLYGIAKKGIIKESLDDDSETIEPLFKTILKQNNVKAAFFITAHYLNTASELVERMINEGHIVGNHTVNHPSMPSISDEEIEKEIKFEIPRRLI